MVTDLVSQRAHGAAMGFLATIMDIGQMLGPIITGIILASFGYSGSFLSLGAVLFGTTLLFGAYQKLKSSDDS
jgi:predicted MFS family arabinose efflux permease